jgi:hypothetical protein
MCEERWTHSQKYGSHSESVSTINGGSQGISMEVPKGLTQTFTGSTSVARIKTQNLHISQIISLFIKVPELFQSSGAN